MRPDMTVRGAVDFERVQLANPPLMPDWEGFSIRDDLREAFAASVLMETVRGTDSAGRSVPVAA